MNEINISDVSEVENLIISEEELPDVISEQFNAIIEIDKRIREANEMCERSKKQADKMIVAKIINKKDAINSTQDAVRSLTEAQTALADAQKMLFENQEKMANGMRYLLVLGASGIAMNRIVISELQLKLKNATHEQLSQKARDELIGVVKLLREQESAFSKQDRLSDEIKSQGLEIENIHRIDAMQDEVDKKHDTLIEINANKNTEQDEQIAETIAKNEEQNKELLRQQQVDKLHEEQIKKNKNLASFAVFLGCVSLILAIVALII